MKISKFIAICLVAAVYVLAAVWLFPISAERSYDWTGGLLHGVLFLPNYIWSLFAEEHLWSAPLRTDAYMVWWWIGAVGSIIEFLTWGYFTRLHIFSHD